MLPRRFDLKSLALLGCLLLALFSPAATAEDAIPTASPFDWDVRFQSTYVTQSKRAFRAAYSGGNSLSSSQEASYSFTATAAFGVRLWPGTEIYLNPEVAQGVPLSGLTGLGGFPNGELARTSGAVLKLYRARSLLRQTWDLGGDEQKVEADTNQLAGTQRKERLVFTAGTLSVQDLFDDNTYAHDPRAEFLNWALLTHGAFDFAADARGYTSGFALEYFRDDWAIRFGRFAQPKQPNGQSLDYRLFKNYGDQIEIERAHTLASQPGKLRLLAFCNVATMARFSDALTLADRTGTTPSIENVRTGQRAKVGVGINAEQSITPEIGVFARAMWADGKTETYAYTEIDRSLSLGTSITGASWGRSQDVIGLALASNELSASHRAYLARGGLGFFIGDGALNYRPETITEAFYRWNVMKAAWLSADFQSIRNPAYNADRGPVRVASVRLHTEF